MMFEHFSGHCVPDKLIYKINITVVGLDLTPGLLASDSELGYIRASKRICSELQSRI